MRWWTDLASPTTRVRDIAIPRLRRLCRDRRRRCRPTAVAIVSRTIVAATWTRGSGMASATLPRATIAAAPTPARSTAWNSTGPSPSDLRSYPRPAATMSRKATPATAAHQPDAAPKAAAALITNAVMTRSRTRACRT